MRKEKIKALNLLIYRRYTIEDGVTADLIGRVMALSSDAEITKFIDVVDKSSKSERKKIRACIDFINDTMGCCSSWTLSDVLMFNNNHWFLEDVKCRNDLVNWFLSTFEKYRSEPFSEDEINDALRNASISINGTLIRIININNLIPENFYKTEMINITSSADIPNC